ncbi:hypothetical protein [Amycolatopsis sp. cmx-4-68]|uniref:hypothetical protein n=1 Tax=Amycolatopsis sp. cmx-4-68 TaxID=2790938 RepID=UPI00397A5585
MKITEVMTATGSVVTALGIIIGGLLAYRRLLSGRTFRPRLDVDLAASLVDVGRSRGLQVEVSLSNVGQSTLRLAQEYSHQLRVVGIREAVWQYAVNDASPVEWTAGFFREQDLFSDKGIRRLLPDADRTPFVEELKPNDVVRRTVLVPHFEGACAYLVLLTVQACTHIGPWQARRHRGCATDRSGRYQFHARRMVPVPADAAGEDQTEPKHPHEVAQDD